MAASDALDSGVDAGITVDKADKPRPFGGPLDFDIGAYERPYSSGLVVGIAGEGSGQVSSEPPGINCGPAGSGTCSLELEQYSIITLTASAGTGSTFAGWSGACTNASGDCVVTLDAAKEVTATFDLTQYPLTVSTAGTGSGTITSDPAGVDCAAGGGGDCSEP